LAFINKTTAKHEDRPARNKNTEIHEQIIQTLRRKMLFVIALAAGRGLGFGGFFLGLGGNSLKTRTRHIRIRWRSAMAQGLILQIVTRENKRNNMI